MIKRFFKKRKVKISLGIVGIFIFLFLVWGRMYYSKTAVIDRYIAARSLKTGDTFDNIKGYLVWSDTKEKITFEESKYAKFERVSSDEKDQMKKELKASSELNDMYVTAVGRRFLFFPNYKIAMKPLTLTIKTNVNNMDILLNDKKVTTSDSEDFTVKVKHLPQADYTAWLVGQYHDRSVKLSREYDGKHRDIDLTVSFKNFTVASNLTSGELYFDKTKIGTLTDGKYQVTDYPLTSSAKAYVKKTFSDGTVSSRKKDLSTIAENETITLDVPRQLDNETAGKLLVSAFDQLAKYADGLKDPETVASVFEGGLGNPFYKGLKSSVQSKLITDKRVASKLTIPSILLTNVDQIGKSSYALGFSAEYYFYFDKATDLTNETYGDVVQKLTGVVTVKKVGNAYRVSKTGSQNITVSNEESRLKKEKETSLDSFPSELIGTWDVRLGNTLFTFTFDANGTITRKAKDAGSSEETISTAKVTKLVEKGKGIYLYRYDPSSDVDAFTTPGMGGSGVKYAYGIKVDGKVATIVLWETHDNGNFDYQTPIFGNKLTKR